MVIIVFTAVVEPGCAFYRGVWPHSLVCRKWVGCAGWLCPASDKRWCCGVRRIAREWEYGSSVAVEGVVVELILEWHVREWHRGIWAEKMDTCRLRWTWKLGVLHRVAEGAEAGGALRGV